MLSMWDILMCLHRNKRIIVLVAVLAMLFGYYYADSRQSYNAQVVFKYVGEGAEKGFTDSGAPLDPYEITNPQIIERALETLSIPVGAMPSVRTRINITPIVPKEEEEKNKSILENAFQFEKSNSEYSTYYPVYYKVEFSASKAQGIAYARNVLNAVMDQYVMFYSEKYLQNAAITDLETNLSVEDYDFIEMVDIIESRLNSVMTYMSQFLINEQAGFRSSSTGLTFKDTISNLNYLKNVDLPIVYGEIMDHHVTNNRDYLVKKLEYNADLSMIEATTNHRMSDDAYELMLLYAEKNEVSLWDSPDSKGSDQAHQVTEVRDDYAYSKVKMTYDDLVDDFTEDEIASRGLLIDSKNKRQTAEHFRNDISCTAEQYASVETKIKDITEKCSTVIKNAMSTADDYNKFIAADSIQYISGILVSANIQIPLYVVVFAVCGAGLCIVLVFAWSVYKNIREECIRQLNEKEEKGSETEEEDTD